MDELVKRAKDGDQDAYTELYKQGTSDRKAATSNRETVRTTMETLHSPHGTPEHTCPKCFLPCPTLFAFHEHMRQAHGDRQASPLSR